jgi:hypothetical protein
VATLPRPLAGALAVALAAAVAAAASWLGAQQNATIDLIADETYQTMNGWEVTPRIWEINKKENRFDASWKPFMPAIMDRMVNELGVNRVRLEFRSGFENRVDYWSRFMAGTISYQELGSHWYEAINDNDDPMTADPRGFQFSELDFQVENVLLPMRRLMARNGEKPFVNLCFVDFRSDAGKLEHALNPEEYAELTLAAFAHLKAKYDIVPDALQIILEPDNTAHWRGEQIGRAMVAALARLRANGFAPQVIAPSTSKARNALPYLDAMVSVPGVTGLLTTFSYHRYDNPSEGLIIAIRKRAAQHRLQTAMLEHLTGDARELHTDLKQADVSAWQMWGVATRTGDRSGGGRGYYYEVDFFDPVNPQLRMTSRSRELSQYFRFIRLGATRIRARTDNIAKDPVAFRNADGTYVVVVNASTAGSMSIRGLPAGTYGIRYTTASEAVDAPQAVPLEAGQALAASIPAPGVITIYGKRP